MDARAYENGGGDTGAVGGARRGLEMAGRAAASVPMEGVEPPEVTSSEGAGDQGECGCCRPDGPMKTVRDQFLACGPATPKYINIINTVFPACPLCTGKDT